MPSHLFLGLVLTGLLSQKQPAAQVEGNAIQRPTLKTYRLEYRVEEGAPQGQRKVVAERRDLSTFDGRPASFLSGGELEIKRPQDKEPVYLGFGRIVNFLPQTKDETHVRAQMVIEISHLDETKKGPDPRVMDFRLRMDRTLTLDKAIRLKRPKRDGSPGYYLCTICVREDK